jgi:hypothetical protein
LKRAAVYSPRRDRERNFEVTQQLAGALADAHPALGALPARTHDKQVSMLPSHHTLQRARNREVGLNDHPGIWRQRIANLRQHRGCLLFEALPVHLLWQYDERVRMNGNEHHLSLRRASDRRCEHDRVLALRVAAHANGDPRDCRRPLLCLGGPGIYTC